MSYDLALYTSRGIPLTPPDPGTDFQFAVDAPARCEDEDIPAHYRPLIGRRRWVINIYIEGHPPRSALADFDTWLAETITSTSGVLIDEQSERWTGSKTGGTLPSTQAAHTARNEDSATWGQMSFFFEDVEAFAPRMLPNALTAIADILPEALPARWGQYEPLQGKVEAGDVGPLLAAFQDDPDQFMRAKAPFSFIYSNIASKVELAKWHPNHFRKRQFLAGRVCFHLRPKALELARLQELFWALSQTFDVFYSEIRDHECPVRAWFWHGLPAGPVRAFALGPPYTPLWPEAGDHAIASAGGRILVAPTRLDPTMPAPPAHLRDPGDAFLPHRPEGVTYAETFPFHVPVAQ